MTSATAKSIKVFDGLFDLTGPLLGTKHLLSTEIPNSMFTSSSR